MSREVTSLGLVLKGVLVPYPFREMSGFPYLGVVLTTPVVAQFIHFLAPTELVLKGQPAGVVVNYGLTAVAVLLWLLYRPRESWSRRFKFFLAALLAVWAVGMAMSLVHGDNFNLVALLLPVAVMLVWFKKPSLRDIWRAGDAFAWAVLGAAVAAQSLSWLGFVELRSDYWNRLPIIGDLIGPIGRWEGPFGNVNYVGPLGAYVVIYGLLRRGASRVIFVAGGLLLMFFSDSRTAWLALAAALVVGLAFSTKIGGHTVPVWLKWASAAALVVVVVAYVALIDPTLNARTLVWATFIDLWQSSPLIGVGASGITEAVDAGLLPGWANHGHSLFLDPLGRAGVVGFASVVLVVLADLRVTWSAARSGSSAGLVLLTVSLAAGLTEDLVDWRYLGYLMVPLLVAGMVGAAETAPRDANQLK